MSRSWDLRVPCLSLLSRIRPDSTSPAPAFAETLGLNAIAVGSGAMVVLRSKLFTIRFREQQGCFIRPGRCSWTPCLALWIGRLTATALPSGTSSSTTNSDHARTTDRAVAYFQMSLMSVQNLTQEEKKDLNEIVADYKNVTQWVPRSRRWRVGFAF